MFRKKMEKRFQELEQQLTNGFMAIKEDINKDRENLEKLIKDKLK